MPKRLLDGERLWTSEKLGKVNPESFRAEYANMLPLALANGVFECTPLRIWRDVYSFNRPAFKSEKVCRILNEFERVRLLFRWKEEEKIWGFWVGIKKDGLLPPKSQMERHDYKTGPEPPLRLLDDFLCYQIDSGLNPRVPQEYHQAGFALAFASGSPLVSSSNPEDTDMSFKNNISDKSLEILGVRIFPQDAGWSDMNSYVRVKGQFETREAFEAWAKEHQGDEIRYPLTEFLRVSERYFSNESAPKLKDSKPLILDLSYMSDGAVSFNQKQSIEIARLLETCSEADIKAAFREFLDTLDDFSVKFAAKDFTEKAEQFIYTRRKRAEAAAQQEEMLKKALIDEQEKARLEREAAAQREREEAELAEDTL